MNNLKFIVLILALLSNVSSVNAFFALKHGLKRINVKHKIQNGKIRFFSSNSFLEGPNLASEIAKGALLCIAFSGGSYLYSYVSAAKVGVREISKNEVQQLLTSTHTVMKYGALFGATMCGALEGAKKGLHGGIKGGSMGAGTVLALCGAYSLLIKDKK